MNPYFTHDYYKNMLELQEKLRKSEQERIRLEERFSLMASQTSRMKHEAWINKLRMRYIEFLEDQRLRDERNHKLLSALDKIDSSLALISLKTDKLCILKKEYEASILRAHEFQRVANSVTYDSGVMSSQNEGLKKMRTPQIILESSKQYKSTNLVLANKPIFNHQFPSQLPSRLPIDSELSLLQNKIASSAYSRRNLPEYTIRAPEDYSDRRYGVTFNELVRHGSNVDTASSESAFRYLHPSEASQTSKLTDLLSRSANSLKTMNENIGGNELDCYISKIRNFHNKHDQSLLDEAGDHEQNTSGDLLNVTLSDDGFDHLPIEEKKEGDLPKQIDQVNMSFANNLTNKTPEFNLAVKNNTMSSLYPLKNDNNGNIHTEESPGSFIKTTIDNDVTHELKLERPVENVNVELSKCTDDDVISIESSKSKETICNEEEGNGGNNLEISKNAQASSNFKNEIENGKKQDFNTVNNGNDVKAISETNLESHKIETGKTELKDNNAESNGGDYREQSEEVYNDYNNQAAEDVNQQYDNYQQDYQIKPIHEQDQIEANQGYQTEPNQEQYHIEPNQEQYQTDPNQEYQYEGTEEYKQDTGENYQYDQQQYAEYVNNPNGEYVNNPNTEYQNSNFEYQDGNLYTDTKNQEYVENDNTNQYQEYPADANQTYQSDYMQGYDANAYQNSEFQEQEYVNNNQDGQFYTSGEEQNYQEQVNSNDVEAVQEVQEETAENKADNSEQENAVDTNDNENVYCMNDNVLSKQKNTINESDTDTTMEINASNTETDFDFN